MLNFLIDYSIIGKNTEGKMDSKVVSTILTFCLLSFMIIKMHSHAFWADPIWMYVLILSKLFKSYLSKKRFDIIISLIASGFVIISFVGTFSLPILLLTIISTVLMLLLIYLKTDTYNIAYKIVLYIFGIVICLISSIYLQPFLENAVLFRPHVILFIMLAIHSLLYVYSPLAYNPDDNYTDFQLPAMIACHMLLIIMLTTTFILKDVDQYALGILILFLLPVGLKTIWQNREEFSEIFIISIIECSLVTFLLCYALDFSGIFADIVAIIISTLYIILGFMLSSKFPRLYGLIVILIMIFKMILFDFHYSTALGYAFGFLLAGFICLGISLLYNFINKRIED